MVRFLSASKTRRFCTVTLGGALFALALGLPSAQAQGDQVGHALSDQTPSDFVQSLGDETAVLLADKTLSPAARRQALQSLLESRFDIAAISRFVLGRHWHDISESERAEFAALFSDFVLATYGRHLDGFSSYRLKVGRAIDKKQHGVYVTSVLTRSGKADLQVVWRLRRENGKWRAVDLIVEGVSLALTHRAEVDSMIRHSRMAGLLDRMRAVIAKANDRELGGAS